MARIGRYLVGYLVLSLAAVIALWLFGVLRRDEAEWISAFIVIAIGVGALMASTRIGLARRRPARRRHMRHHA